MTQQMPPPTPTPQDQYQPSPSRVGHHRRVALCVLAVAAVAAVAAVVVVLVGDARDDDGEMTTTGVTTTVNANATTRSPTTSVVPATSAAPVGGYGTAKKYTAVVVTNKGELTIQLDPALAPIAVNNFVSLARSKYFDATQCHRIIPTFVVQCGDPTATGRGGPGYEFIDELPKAGQYKIGSLAMANSGVNTNGSQFFIVTGAQGVALPPNYSLSVK